MKALLKPLAKVHRVMSFPLLRLGEAAQQRASAQTGVEGILGEFLHAELAKLIEVVSATHNNASASTEAIAAVSFRSRTVSISHIMTEMRQQFVKREQDRAIAGPRSEAADESYEGSAAQDLGRSLVFAISILPACVAAVAPCVLEALAEACGQHQAQRVLAHLCRLLACHAHSLCASFDLDALFQPVELFNHILPLSLKQLAIIRMSRGFARDLEEKSGARVCVMEHDSRSRKKDGRYAIWSLKLRGTFAQLLKVERELERVQASPPPADWARFEHAKSGLLMSVPVSRDAAVDFWPQPAEWLVNPVHLRRGARVFQFEVPAQAGSNRAGAWRGNVSLEDVLQPALNMIQPFQEAEINIKLGTLYVLDPPDAVLGPSPARRLTAWEAITLLAGPAGACEVKLPKTSGKGRGKDRRKGGGTWALKFLKSGFSSILASSPHGFCPSESFVTAKFRMLKHGGRHVSVKMVFTSCGLVVAKVSADETRLLSFTERVPLKVGAPFRGDVRVALNAQTPVSPEELLFKELVDRPPVFLPRGDPTSDRDWFLYLQLATDGGYEFETVRAHHRERKPMPNTGGYAYVVNRVVWLLPADRGSVVVEADVCEVGAKLDMGLDHRMDALTLAPELQEAMRQLQSQ